MKALLIGVLVKGAKAKDNTLESATIAVERKAGDEVKVSYVNLRAYGKNVETIVSQSNGSGDGVIMIHGNLDIESIGSMNVPVVTVEKVTVMPAGSPHMSLVYGIGNLTRDAEVRQINDQWRVMSASIAANRKIRGNDTVSYYNLSLFGKVGQDGKCRASNTAPHMTKGKGLSISGQLDVQVWQDREDPTKEHTSINIILDGFNFLPGGKRDESPREAAPQYGESPKQSSAPSYVNMPESNLPEIEITEDEIPF